MNKSISLQLVVRSTDGKHIYFLENIESENLVEVLGRFQIVLMKANEVLTKAEYVSSASDDEIPF